MLPDEKIMCHRTGFQMSCFDGVTKCKCRLWTHVTGVGPDGQAVDFYGCADEIAVKLALTGAQETHQVGAAIESFRNEMVRQNLMIIEGQQTLRLNDSRE